MKRRIVATGIFASLVAGMCMAQTKEAIQFDPAADILTPACDDANDAGLSLDSQKNYWRSAEATAKAADSSGLGGKNRADRWFFDRITLEAGYSFNGSTRISDYPDTWSRDDKPYGGVKYVLPFSALREKGQQEARSAALSTQREWETAKRRAAFYSEFVQLRNDLATSGKRGEAVKRALAIGATSADFAKVCLNPELLTAN
jgi:hypothetical protein